MTESEEPEQADVPPSLERVIFFSDAVFAIAMTLLAIDLAVPAVLSPNTDRQLLDELGRLAASLFSYALSFGVVGMYWLSHWRRFNVIARTDETLAVINLVLLGFVALIPFPTAILGAHGDLPVALVLYVAILSAGGIVGALSWVYAYRAGLCRTSVGPLEFRVGLLRSLSGPIVMVASLPLVAVDATLAELCWILIFPLQIVLRRVAAV